MNIWTNKTASLLAATGLGLAVLIAGGCEKKQSESISDAVKKTTSDAAKATETAAKDAVDATKEAAEKVEDKVADAWKDAQKQLVDGAQPKLDALKAQIETMKQKVAGLGAETKPAAQGAVAEIEKQYDTVAAQFTKLKNATSDNFNAMGTEFGNQLDKLIALVKDASTKFGLGA